MSPRKPAAKYGPDGKYYRKRLKGPDGKAVDVFGCTADYLLCRSARPAPELTPAEEELLFAYAAATPEIRDIVDNALSRYKKDGGESTATA